MEKGINALGCDEPFIIVYYSSGSPFQSLERPLRTITTRDRFGLVIPTLKGHMMRMLQPDELLVGHGFSPLYKVLGSKKDQVCQIGNAVSPGVMKAVVKTLAA
ncbi:MAG: DNA cytosine methyltransferase [Bacteroides sp.]|nr:DNA cytosine methyltransferase [Bacteroides sp.]